MTTRFEAEEILRAAASFDIPSPGETLIRTEDGWIFGTIDASTLPPASIGPDQITSLPFTKITGQIANGQVPLSAVQQYQAQLLIAFSQLTGQIADGQVPRSAVFQHLGEILANIDFLIARAVTNRPTSPAEKLYMAENYG